MNGFSCCGAQREISRSRIHKIALEPASQIVPQSSLAAVEPNFPMDQIVRDIRVGRPGSDSNASGPVPLWPPDGIVIDLNPLGMPKLDPAIRPTEDEVIADNATGNINEPLLPAIRRGLAGIAEGHTPVAVEDEVSFHGHLPGAHPDEYGGASAAVTAFDVAKAVVAESPLLKGHHVDGADVVAAEQPVRGRHPRVLENAIADGTLHSAGIGILPRGPFDGADADVAEPAVVDVNILRRILRFDLDSVRVAIREVQVGDSYAITRADMDEVVTLSLAGPSLAPERDLGRITGRASDREVLLLSEDNDSRQFVFAIGQENRSARRDTLNRCEQFIRIRDSNDIAFRLRERWSFWKPCRRKTN